MRLQKLIQTLRADLHPTSDRGNMVRSAGITACLKVGSVLIAFVASLVYARALGPHGFGLYAYVIAWTSILAIPASLGLPAYLVREGAKAPANLHWLRRWADLRVLVSCSVAGGLLACAVFIPQAADARWLFVIAAPLPLLNNLGAIRQALLQAHGWVARSQWPSLILAPISMLSVLLALWWWHGRLHAVDLVAVMTASGLIPLLANQWQLKRAMRAQVSEVIPAARVRAALPFMWLGVLTIINTRTDLIMVGSLRGAEDAGIYAVSSRAAELVPFLLMAANSVIAPRISHLYQQGSHTLLQRLITASTRRVVIASMPLGIVLIVGAYPILGMLFGSDYQSGAIVLQILAAGQLFNILAGPSGTVLNMTGHEKLTMIGVGLSAVLNIMLNAILIPTYGVTGAAVATCASLVVWNVFLWHWARQWLHLRTDALTF